MRKSLHLSLVLCVALGLLLAASFAAADAPLAEKYLLDGKLAEGAKALEGRLKETPKDDQARFGLGVLQFRQTFEHLGTGLYKYGLRTEKAFLRPPAQVKEFLPQNPNPEKLTYAAARQLVQTFVDDLARAEATLAEVKDPAVKLPLPVGLIKIDPFGQGKPISAAFLFERIDRLPVTSQQAQGFVIGFDRGDVSWLRGYCHFLAALGELYLSVDGQHGFDCSAHLLFEKVETPHAFLLESRRAFDENPFENVASISDVISFFHQMTRLSIKEPARTRAALEAKAVAARKEGRGGNGFGMGFGGGQFGQSMPPRRFIEKRTQSVAAQLAGTARGFEPKPFGGGFGPPPGGGFGPPPRGGFGPAKKDR